MTTGGCADPLFQLVRVAFFEQAQEVLTELIRSGEFLAGLTHLLELPLLLRCELLFGQHKKPGGLLRRKSPSLGSSHWSRTRRPWAF